METLKQKSAISWQPRVASLMIPILMTILTPVFFYNALSLHQFLGSGILLAIIMLTLFVGELKNIPPKDISILWVASILYNLYLVSYAL